MAMEKMDPMKEALNARRGKGLEVIIGLGKGPGEGDVNAEDGASAMHSKDEMHDGKRSDLAPPKASMDNYGKDDESTVGDHGNPQESKGKRSEDQPRDIADIHAAQNSAEGLHAPHPEGVIAGQHEYAPGDVPDGDAKAYFSKNMSENDIRDMADRKPRSLMERARQHAFKQKKQ